MTGSRGKCRAVRSEPVDGSVGSCTASVDALVLVRVEGPHPSNPRFVKIGLCKFHTRQWLDHLENGGPPVRYKPHRPLVVEDLP